MTWIVSDKHPLDHRPYSKRQGQPYYGAALRRLLANDPPTTKAERDEQYRVLWSLVIAWFVVALGVAVYAVSL